jgi:hypothetical protein
MNRGLAGLALVLSVAAVLLAMRSQPFTHVTVDRARRTSGPISQESQRRYLLNQPMVSFHDSSAAALLYRCAVASLLKPCTAPG